MAALRVLRLVGFSYGRHYRHATSLRISTPLVKKCNVRALSSAFGPIPSAVGCVDYDHEIKTFKLEKPEYFNFTTDVIDKWASKEKQDGTENSNPAFWWVNDHGNELKWSWQELSDLTKCASNVLTKICNLQPGDRVVTILPRLPQWWLINLACIRTGTILIPGTTQLTAKDIRYRLKLSEAKCVVVDMPTANKVDEVLSDCPSVVSKLIVRNETVDKEPINRAGWSDFNVELSAASNSHEAAKTKSDDPSMIFFTSGTTGEPKMAEHSHSSYGIGHQSTARYYLDATPQDVMWNWSDTGWAKSAYCSVFAPWIAGSCVFIHDTPAFDARRCLEVLEKYPVSIFCAAPTLYRMLIQENVKKFSFSSLRHCCCAGEPLNAEVTNSWYSLTGVTIREGYGQTETVLTVCTPRCIPCKPGSMGKPSPGYVVKVIDDDCNECPVGVEGDIAVKVKPDRPVGLYLQYVDEPGRTAAALRGDYYITGDRCVRDEDGYLWFVGRGDDVILSAGYRIGPFEVESALLEHPAVAESAVVSSPDEVRGEVVKAFVMLSPAHADADKEVLKKELQEHVKTLTAPYKYPRKIEFLDQLPKTVSGKIRRVELRDMEWGRLPSA